MTRASKAYGYDPKKAKELLKQAGYPNGVDITLHTGTSAAFNRQLAEAIAEMLTEVGLRTNLKIWDPGPAWNKFFQGEGKATNGFIGSWGYYSTFDADAILHPLYHTEPGGWVGKWYTRVPGLDELIDDGTFDGRQGETAGDLRQDPAPDSRRKPPASFCIISMTCWGSTSASCMRPVAMSGSGFTMRS